MRALVTGVVVEEGNPLGSGGGGNATEGNPLGSGGGGNATEGNPLGSGGGGNATEGNPLGSGGGGNATEGNPLGSGGGGNATEGNPLGSGHGNGVEMRGSSLNGVDTPGVSGGMEAKGAGRKNLPLKPACSDIEGPPGRKRLQRQGKYLL